MNSTEEDTLKQCIEHEKLGEYEVTYIKNVTIRVLLVLCLISSIIQLHIIVNAIKNVRRQTTDRCIHIFLLNMTVADLLLTGIAYPLEFIMDLFQIGYPYYVNLMMHILLWLGTSVSGLSLVMMNLEKLVFFKFPLSHSKWISPLKAHGLAASTWLASAIFINLTLYTGAFECQSNCEVLRTGSGSRYGPIMYLLFIFFVSVFPAISSLTVALYLMRVVRSHRKRLNEEISLCKGNAERRNKALLSRMRTFYFIFISTVFTFLTLIPYRIQTIYRIIAYANTEILSCFLVLLSVLTYYNMDLNAIFNPVITVTVLPQYRMAFLRTVFAGRKRFENGDSIKYATTVL